MADVKPLIIDGIRERRFNPATDSLVGNFDEQSGRYFVATGDTFLIDQYYQSIIMGGLLDLEGDLLVDGQLYMED